jgi:FKBP-type peptidyl-prolyl cis-trans isomerase (trigger factor)
MITDIKDTAKLNSISINIPKSELEAKFNEYWNSVKDILPADLIKKAKKGGYRQVTMPQVIRAAGGKAEFFAPVLTETVIEMAAKNDDKNILYVSKVELEDGIDTSTIRALVYFEPEVKWLKDPPEKFTVSIPKMPENAIQLAVENEIETMRSAKATLVSVDRPSTSGDIVTVNVDATFLDGTKYEEATVRNAKWPLDKRWHKTDELYAALFNRRKGDRFQITLPLLDDIKALRPQDDKAVLNIEIVDVFEIQRPELDDRFAARAGFTDLAAMRSNLENKHRLRLNAEREDLIWSKILDQLIDPQLVSVSPVPFLWMKSKALSIWSQARASVRTEEELLSKLRHAVPDVKLDTKADALSYFAMKSAQNLIVDLIIRSWGKRVGISGDTSLENLADYVMTVKLEAVRKFTTVEETDATI